MDYNSVEQACHQNKLQNIGGREICYEKLTPGVEPT